MDLFLLCVVLLTTLPPGTIAPAVKISRDESEESNTSPVLLPKPKSCPFFNAIKVPDIFQAKIATLWIVTKISPAGFSKYKDGSSACGIHNFVVGECQCLRYSVSIDEDGLMLMKTIGLNKELLSFRYMENRIVFIEDNLDVFQAQNLMSATLDFSGGGNQQTISPIDEELYTEYQPFALLGTDNYETFAVYGLCTPTNKMPVVWVAVPDEVFTKGIPKETHQSITRILEDNNIDHKSLVHVNQKQCSP